MPSIKYILTSLLDLVFPNQCAVCGENLLQSEELLCTKCYRNIPRTNFHLQKENAIEKRFWGKTQIENASAFFFFQKGSAYRHLLHLLKYKGNQNAGVVLGRMAAAELLESDNFRSFDYIVPVPLHPSKLRKRGYNQSECIATGLSEILKIPVETKTLFRAVENPTQTKKSVYERWENTQCIFALHNKSTFADKHVLLVDDVLTTGSTLIACTQTILESGNTKVSVFTLASA